LSDDGAAIPSYYTRTIFRSVPSNKRLLSARIEIIQLLDALRRGAGNLGLTSFVDTPNSPQAQQPLPMSSPHRGDLELPINILGERVAFSGKHQSGRRLVPPAKIHSIGSARSLGAVRGFN